MTSDSSGNGNSSAWNAFDTILDINSYARKIFSGFVEKSFSGHTQCGINLEFVSPDAKKLRGANVLITGGLGFIGSNLAHALVEVGANVTLIDSLIPEYGGNLFNVDSIRDRVKINIADLRDHHAMAHWVKGQDVLFNLAGQTSHLDSMSDPLTDLNINAAAQLYILEACRKHNPSAKIVFASTRQLYGKPQYLPVDEQHPVQPVDVNGVNKLAGEWYHILYHRVHNLKTCALRLTNTYGPRMRVRDARQTFLGIWIRKVIERQPFQIFGTGLQLRDFNYVDDVVEALLQMATDPAAIGHVFNLGHFERISLIDTADLLVCLQPGARYEVTPFPPDRQAIDIGDYYGDSAAIEKALGWKPKVLLKDGLQRTLNYFTTHHSHYWEAAS